jgi:phosphoenolpyruvate carboxylase
MTQEELDALMSENLDDMDEEINKSEENSENLNSEEIFPPPADDNHKVVAQLDEVTKESEEKATQILEKVEGISAVISKTYEEIQKIIDFLNEEKELFNKLHNAFPDPREEVEEALRDILPPERGGLGLDEKMVDYEGKLTPYHQVQWIVEELLRHGMAPGEDFLVTPRIPSERLENPERQMMVLWGVLVANKKALEKAGQEAVRYIINPMSSTGYEVFVVQRRILKLQRLAEEELGLKSGQIEVIPLVEDFEALLHVDKILEGMKNALLSHLGMHYQSYRVLLGKSDTALAYGHATSSLALVYALSRLGRWAEEENTRVYPILGVGALPFRGHLAPEAVTLFREQYRGYSTVTLQSGIRYDHPPEDVHHVVKALREGMNHEPRLLDPETERLAIKAARVLTREYLRLLVRLVDRINLVAQYVPKRRARLSHNQYGRSLDTSIAFAGDHSLVAGRRLSSLRLPRAIKFSAALYTMGLPPALIGLGRGLQAVEKQLGGDALETILRLLPMLKEDIIFDAGFTDLEVFEMYVSDPEARRLAREDVMEEWIVARVPIMSILDSLLSNLLLSAKIPGSITPKIG